MASHQKGFKQMNMATVLFALLIQFVSSYPGEIVQGCVPANKSWTEEYRPWGIKEGEDDRKYAYVHLSFDDGPDLVHTPVILDILLEYNIPATFFINTNKMNNETIPILRRMINEGHTIGSHSHSHKNLLYSNDSLMHQEIDLATDLLTNFLGERPKLYRPAFGALDNRSHEYLRQEGYTIVLWSGGCVDWYFDWKNISLDISVAAMLYSSAEEGAIFCMHDYAQSGSRKHDGKYLRTIIDTIYGGVNFVDLLTCLGRTDINDGALAIDNNNVLNLNSYSAGGWFVLILIIFIICACCFGLGAYFVHYKINKSNSNGYHNNDAMIEAGTIQNTNIIKQDDNED